MEAQKGRKALSKLPRDRVLTETDGLHVKIGKRPAEPSDVRLVINALAESWDLSVKETELQVYKNLRPYAVTRPD